MTDYPGGETLAALLDALTVVQGQLEEVGEGNRRIEATQAEIMARLDAGAGPDLEHVVALMARDREATRNEIARVAQLVVLVHAAAMGQGASLPDSVIDDELLELYVLTQPADRASTDRALRDWHRAAKDVGSTQLAEVLRHQYQPSPTDTLETRRLRYRLAAISREELEGRGVGPPHLPSSTFPVDASAAAREARSAELARIWSAVNAVDLYADPELAGAMDVLAEADRQGAAVSETEFATGVADLRRIIADRLAAGERPQLAAPAPSAPGEPAQAIENSRNR